MATENLSRIASDFETQLSGAIAIGATEFTIQSIVDLDGEDLSDGIYCFTIDRDSTGAKEYLVGQLTGSTKTVSSISSVGRQGVLTANAQRAHRIGANVIISDHSILAAISRIFTGQGTINPAAPLTYTTDPTLTASTDIATKGYVDSVVSGGTVNTDRIILGSQTAGETVAAGSIVYFKSSDSRWWKAKADTTATFQNVQIGVALGAGTAGNAITGGVLVYGKCDSFTGLTATATYYLSDTAGAVATSAGTYSIILGQAFATTGIFFNPSYDLTVSNAIAITTGASDANKIIKTDSRGLIDPTFTTAPIIRKYLVADSPATWSKPTGLKYVIVEVVGGGGGGGGVDAPTGENSAAAGGGAGGYTKKLIATASLGSTETVTIGAGGAGGTSDGGNGAAGSTSSFGSHCSATGGALGYGQDSGGSAFDTFAAGGVGTGGDINIVGGCGQPANSGSTSSAKNEGSPGVGGSSFFGGSSVGLTTGPYGAGGHGAMGYNGSNSAGADGGNGIVIVTEYYN